MVSKPQAMHQVEIGEAIFAHSLGNKREESVIVLASHAAINTIRRQAESNTAWRKSTTVDDGLSHFLQKSNAIFGASTVFVRARIGRRLKELILCDRAMRKKAT